jgi:phospholipid/cholesterol/gamma-HCH transport system substrate-binding protein
MLGFAVLLAGVAAAVISVTAINGLPFSDRYRVEAIVPASGPIVRPGDEVRIAGRRVGEVREVEPAADGRQVSMELTDGAVGPEATATVRLRGLAGAVFIELDPGPEGEMLDSGATIPRARTSAGVQLTDVIEGFDARTRTALREAATGYGAGIAERGEGLNRTLADLPPALDGATALLGALERRPGSLAGVLGDAGTVARALGSNAPALAELITATRATLEAAAAEREAIGEAIEATPGAEDELAALSPDARPLLDDAAATARELAPAAEALERALPAVNSVLDREPELGGLARIARAASPLLDTAGPVVDGLEPGALTMAPLIDAGEPLAAYAGDYGEDIFNGPYGFTTWGKFAYDFGQAPGARAVRFAPVFTCAPGRDPYPAPGEAASDRMPCDG